MRQFGVGPAEWMPSTEQLLHDAAAQGTSGGAVPGERSRAWPASLAAASHREGSHLSCGHVNRGRDDVGPGRRLRAVENGPSAARLTMRRRLGVCRTPVKHRFGHEGPRPPGDESAPPPMGPAAGPFTACAVTALTRRPGPTSSRPRVHRRSDTRVNSRLASREPRRGWLARPVERADALRSRNGGAAIPRVVFRPCDPCRRSIAMSGRERLTTVAVRQLLHDAAAAGYERRRRSRRAESGLASQPRRGVSARGERAKRA